ncbi:EF-hand domain-containing protein [Aspergillus homomorphus CBS 101889]|uniref:EF-hand n=1 Tax=Aspergillus homomorphus (strain CBS 101889) TaxID=1450537 RepID=A0A395IBZ2_ASPHC|nr:EF-hand [Aspergillus homomorphus CBS 101889]RAL17551.1 EF-hand [Aspergillus homomorphus CBS 101889]
MPRYTRQEINKWKEVFSRINTNGDRFIEPYELIAAAKEDGLEMSDEEAREWLKDLDCNDNGKVEFSEFIKRFGERT